MRLGHTEEQNGTEQGAQHGPILLPIFDVSSDSCTLQALIDMWHDGLGVCRATQQVGQAIALTISRYLPETGMKHQQKIEFSSTVRFPSFVNVDGHVHFYQYAVSAVIFHVGHTPFTGHYRAALKCGHKWFAYEDGRLPDQLTELSTQILANIVMIWLTPLTDLHDRTPRPASLDGVPAGDDMEMAASSRASTPTARKDEAEGEHEATGPDLIQVETAEPQNVNP